MVTAAGLGTLNHTALTLEALAARKVRLAGRGRSAAGRADPGLAERENLADLETLAGGPLAGLLPEGSGALPARRSALAGPAAAWRLGLGWQLAQR